MSRSYPDDFGDLDISPPSGQGEAEFGALEIQQAQVLFSSLKANRQGMPSLVWEDEAAAEIQVCSGQTCLHRKPPVYLGMMKAS